MTWVVEALEDRSLIVRDSTFAFPIDRKSRNLGDTRSIFFFFFWQARMPSCRFSLFVGMSGVLWWQGGGRKRCLSFSAGCKRWAVPGSSPHLLSQGMGGKYWPVKEQVKKLREPTLGLRGTGVLGLNDCLVVCCMGPGEYTSEKGFQKERRWWIPHTRDAMKRHAAHTT